MGRPGKLGIRSGTNRSPQLSFSNYIADMVAKKLANDLSRNDMAVSASIGLMDPNDLFAKRIIKRQDKDPNGYLDVIAHGTSSQIQIMHNGKAIMIDHRTAAKLIVNQAKGKLKGIRLLSCNTGSNVDGFAQRLADKLHIPVIAPTKYAWVYQDGTHFVAGSRDNGKTPDYLDIGKYKIFYPRRKK